MDDLYREIIIDHYKNPVYKGEIPDSDYSFEDENTMCGDELHIDIKTDKDGVITDARFDGHGVCDFYGFSRYAAGDLDR